MMNIHNINGVIRTDKGKIFFYAEDFKFTFMRDDSSIDKDTIMADENGYIWGNTFDGKTIAIYAQKDVEIEKTRVLITWNYIVSKNNIDRNYMQSFMGLRFKNGVIKTIYPCNALHEDFKKSKDNELVYCIKKDCKEYTFEQGGDLILWSFFSGINKTMSIYEGNSLRNSDSFLDVIFDKEQSYDVFRDYYGYVRDLCSFLTFRDNVTFEKIYLLRGSTYNNREEYAECFVKNLNGIEQRSVMDIIPIRRVDNTVFKNIILNILRFDDKDYKGLPLFIAPQDDRDAEIMNLGKIRNICSALEMELDLGGVNIESSDEMKNLLSSVKKIIKDHRNGSQPLSDKTYDYIFGNIAHWNQPLAERAWDAWKQHEVEMDKFTDKYDLKVTQEMIQEFVKTRNNITHNGFVRISDDVCNTAFCLLGLIYSCTLTRLGMKSEEIQYIMGRKLFV